MIVELIKELVSAIFHFIIPMIRMLISIGK